MQLKIVCLACFAHWEIDHSLEKHSRCIFCEDYSIEVGVAASCCGMVIGRSELEVTFEERDGFYHLCKYCAARETRIITPRLTP